MDISNVHISVVEGIYEKNNHPMARVIGDINITPNTFCKYVKQPYTIINTEDNTITLNKQNHGSYTLLSHLLTAEGYMPEYIIHIIQSIHTLSSNKNIKTNQSCLGTWIDL